jgi:hypothetical protein
MSSPKVTIRRMREPTFGPLIERSPGRSSDFFISAQMTQAPTTIAATDASRVTMNKEGAALAHAPRQDVSAGESSSTLPSKGLVGCSTGKQRVG